MTALRELMAKELAEIYDAEQRLAKLLPKLAESATDSELQAAFNEHAEQTQDQVRRLKAIFEDLGLPAKGKRCAAIDGLLAEAEEQLKSDDGDAALVCLAQKLGHYEIAVYGTLRSWAGLLEQSEASDLLADTLDEEKAIDEKLTELAESTVNLEAAEGEGLTDNEEE